MVRSLSGASSFLASFHLHLLLLATPPLLGVGVIDDLAATLHAYDPPPAAFRRRDPAVPFTRDNVAGWHELEVVTAPPGTANLNCFRAPHFIVIVHFPNQGMGDFMQDRVRQLVLGGLPRERV